ncbi:hypothetical protein TNIN_402911, partial [Trichonephila inaurata madagascariensis]
MDKSPKGFQNPETTQNLSQESGFEHEYLHRSGTYGHLYVVCRRDYWVPTLDRKAWEIVPKGKSDTG